MAKKKFIDKKNSATFRLVFKESSAHDVAGDSERVFTRVDGGNSFVPGFSLDEQESIFDDAEDDEDEEDVRQHECSNGEQGSQHPRSLVNPLPEHLRRELVDLGFPDDGYNYLQHLREIGASGRSGSFVPASKLRLDRLHADVKVYDASQVRVSRTAEDGDNDALLVSQSTTQIKTQTTKNLDPDVTALLDVDDRSACNSADELEDDFIARANEGRENCASARSHSQHYASSDVSNGSLEDTEASGLIYNDTGRPVRLLDEQFDLLALREYEDDDVGELDEEDPSICGPAHISEFNNLMSDSLMNGSLAQEKYQTPAEICRQLNLHNDERDSKITTDGVIDDAPSNSTEFQSSSSEDDKDFIIASDTDENEGLWDCESIVTTYSNLDNHPSEIHSTSKQPGKHSSSGPGRLTEASKHIIWLKGKQQLPVDFLPQDRRLTRVDEKGSAKSGNVSADLKGVKVSSVRQVPEERKKERKKERKAQKV